MSTLQIVKIVLLVLLLNFKAWDIGWGCGWKDARSSTTSGSIDFDKSITFKTTTGVDGGSGMSFGDWKPGNILIGGWRDGSPLATIYPDGHVEINKHSSPNEAAQLFWKAIAQSNPLRGEVDQLRRDLSTCLKGKK